MDTTVSRPPRGKKTKVPLISVQMVSKTYADDPLDYKTLVLRNVYLDIQEGEFVTVFGPSGSGKSTLLNLIAGLERPTGGRILVRRRDLSRFTSDELAVFHRRKMGFVFQNFNLIKSLSVWENVALPLTASGVRINERKRKALRTLKLFHLDQYADRHPNELSGGEQQRVAIARAIINDPYFLLVDEPTGNLDSKSAEGVMNILKDIHAQDKHTIILVTHNPNQLKFATRVVYMEDGQIVIEETRNERGAVTSPRRLGQTGRSPLPAATPPTPTSSQPATAGPAEIVETDVIHTKIIGDGPPAATAPTPEIARHETNADSSRNPQISATWRRLPPLPPLPQPVQAPSQPVDSQTGETDGARPIRTVPPDHQGGE